MMTKEEFYIKFSKTPVRDRFRVKGKYNDMPIHLYGVWRLVRAADKDSTFRVSKLIAIAEDIFTKLENGVK